MIKRLLLLTLSVMVANVVHAGSYTYKQYGGSHSSELVLSNESAAELMSSTKPAKVEQESSGSWMTSLGSFDDQFHDDLEKLISSKNSTRSYARISDSSGKSVSFTGPAIRSGSTTVASSRSANRNTYDIIIESIADKYGVARGLVKAVMHTESSFNPYARSPVGAQGLMQLMPATARRFNVSNSYDPQQNIEGGVKYLSWLMRRFNGDLRLVLAAYNAGEGNVDKYGGIPPFKETQNYVKRVLDRYHGLYKQI